MNWLNMLGIAVGLATDAFAVSIATGLSIAPITRRHVFRLGFHFGLFQFLMPILGWITGQALATHLPRIDPWVAFALLTFVGGKMLWEARQEKLAEDRADPTRGWTLVLLSVATSIDAFAIGLSLAFLHVPVLLPSVVIGIVTGALTTVGITLAGRFGRHFGKWALLGGGLVLVGIGVRILWGYLAASGT